LNRRHPHPQNHHRFFHRLHHRRRFRFLRGRSALLSLQRLHFDVGEAVCLRVCACHVWWGACACVRTRVRGEWKQRRGGRGDRESESKSQSGRERERERERERDRERERVRERERKKDLIPLWAFSRLGAWCACEHGNQLVYAHMSVYGPPFSHSPRAICTVLLDPRDPLLQSERTQGFAAGPVYGRAKCLPMVGAFKT